MMRDSMKRVIFLVCGVPAFAVAVACGNPDATPGPTQSVAAESPAPAPIPSASAQPPTPLATGSPTTLTDTGYLAPDGSPLFAECVSTGLPLPPPTPVPLVASPVPSVSPGEHGVETPSPDNIPASDPLDGPPSDRSGWTSNESACVRVGFEIPPAYSVFEPLTIHGYQQEASASIGTPDRRTVFEVHFFYSPADIVAEVVGSPIAPGEYRFYGARPVTIGGTSGFARYATEPNGYYHPEVSVIVVASPRPNWFIEIVGLFAAPYDPHSFEDFRGLIDSVSFQ